MNAHSARPRMRPLPVSFSGRLLTRPLLKRLLVLGVATFVATPMLAGAANASKAAHYKTLLNVKHSVKAAIPRDRRSHKRVTVVVEMSGQSVAGARALTEDHTISTELRDSIRRASAQEQSGIESEVLSRGGRVLAKFSDAINGVKISIDEAQVEALKSASGVVAVRAVRTYRMNNVESVPFIGAPLVWQGSPKYRGEGQKVAIIDTGLDYTHANFGGPGTASAYETAHAASTLPANPTLFGPSAPKVKGGIDLVGDDYDADADDPALEVPHPDPNPLDCNGHGSHVGGTTAGFGVTAAGATYTGPYTASAITPANFLIGPGVAPKADLYAVRVFGCEGSTNVVVDAIDWAIAHDMDVINMSLGSDYGPADTADAVAAANAAKAGITVVASSGNAGQIPYITGTPASANVAISVAAVDSHKEFPGVNITFNNGSVLAQNSNGGPLPTSPLAVVVLKNPDGTTSLGCNEAEYVDSQIAGKLVVSLRGVCARVDRATLAARHGAAAALMINTSDAFPPYEGPIPDVNIPFFGVPASDQATVEAATSANAFSATIIPNPAYKAIADFSSGGPRFGDSVLKPNIAAPGVSIFSTGVGTGNQGVYISGTSMASPHVAGVAALTRQAHPSWNEKSIRAAIVQTASPKALLDYTPAFEGSGLVQPVGSTKTQAVAFTNGEGGSASISFGFEEFVRDFHDEQKVTVKNLGNTPISFKLSSTKAGGVPHRLRLSQSTIYVPARGESRFEVNLTVPVDTVGATHDEEGNPLFPEVAGYVSLVPANSSQNNGVTLTVPYYLVPRARSNVQTLLTSNFGPKKPHTKALVGNLFGAIPGVADFYAWGQYSRKPQGVSVYDTKAIGVQSILGAVPNDSVLVFAINTFERFSSPELAEFDIAVDVDNNGADDYIIAVLDQGILTGAGAFDGNFVVAVFPLNGDPAFIESLADAPTDGTTVLVPLLASDIGVTSAHPRFSYKLTTFNISDDTSADMPGKGLFNAFTPAITQADAFTEVNPNRVELVPLSINAAEWAKTPALGLMVVSPDNKSTDQTQLIPIK